ncbi:MAG TPA: hypothetical protein VEL75_06000, partial [Candidatus Methylomirabilis sp.]|nr:hypothetical protein [Candidatus Methylomirabilis sp.]
MSSTTLRTMLVLTAAVVALLALSAPAGAQTFVGNFCWRLDPFTDTLQAAVTEFPNNIFALAVRWRGVFVPGTLGTAFNGLNGAPNYQFQGSGSASPDLADGSNFDIAFGFGGNNGMPGDRACTFSGLIGVVGMSGVWSFL